MSRKCNADEEEKMSSSGEEEARSSGLEEECSDRLGEEVRRKCKKKGSRAASMHTMVLGMDASEEVEVGLHGGGGSVGMDASVRRGRQGWMNWLLRPRAGRATVGGDAEGGNESASQSFDEFDESLLLQQQQFQAEEEEQHEEGQSRYCPPALMQSPGRSSSVSDFCEAPAAEDGVMDSCSFFYDGFDDELSSRKTLKASAYSFTQQQHRHHARERSRAAFLAVHNNLNATLPPSFSTARTSPAAPAPSSSDPSFHPHVRGKADVYRTTDYVRLVMDPHLEPGILSVEHPHGTSSFHHKSPLEPLHYQLTVHDDLYRQVIKEVNQSHSTPCGLYYCCHDDTDSNRASIYVAVMLLTLFCLFLLLGTLIYPFD